MKITKLTEVGGVMDIDKAEELMDQIAKQRDDLYVLLVKTEKERDEALAKLAAMESQKFNVKEFIRRCQDRWSFDVKIAAEMLEIAKYTPPVPADKPAVAVPVFNENDLLEIASSYSAYAGADGNLYLNGWINSSEARGFIDLINERAAASPDRCPSHESEQGGRCEG